MIGLISNIDFLCAHEGIRINSKKKFQSIFGGSISLIIIILSSIMTIYLTLQIYFKKEPNIIYSRKLLSEMINYNVTKIGTEFFIAMQYPNSTYYLDETIFTISGTQQEVIFNQKEDSVITSFLETPFKFQKCSDLYSLDELNSKNIHFPSNLFYCPPVDSLKIGGFWGGKFYNSIKISVNKCNNDTLPADSPRCRPIEEINSLINGGIINIFSSDYLLDQQNFDFPIKKYLKDIFDRVSDRNSINYQISYNVLNFINDHGMIFEDLSYSDFAKINEVKISYNFGDDKRIAFFQIYKINYSDTYRRNYPKLQDLLTKVGGL